MYVASLPSGCGHQRDAVMHAALFDSWCLCYEYRWAMWVASANLVTVIFMNMVNLCVIIIIIIIITTSAIIHHQRPRSRQPGGRGWHGSRRCRPHTTPPRTPHHQSSPGKSSLWDTKFIIPSVTKRAALRMGPGPPGRRLQRQRHCPAGNKIAAAAAAALRTVDSCAVPAADRADHEVLGWADGRDHPHTGQVAAAKPERISQWV